jgi:hypothetical protein
MFGRNQTGAALAAKLRRVESDYADALTQLDARFAEDQLAIANAADDRREVVLARLADLEAELVQLNRLT